MLELLHIENIAIIEAADIEFAPGFNALTGETGAGKSIVIDSLSAVLGQRTSRELIRTGAKSALVNAIVFIFFAFLLFVCAWLPAAKASSAKAVMSSFFILFCGICLKGWLRGCGRNGLVILIRRNFRRTLGNGAAGFNVPAFH